MEYELISIKKKNEQLDVALHQFEQEGQDFHQQKNTLFDKLRADDIQRVKDLEAALQKSEADLQRLRQQRDDYHRKLQMKPKAAEGLTSMSSALISSRSDRIKSLESEVNRLTIALPIYEKYVAELRKNYSESLRLSDDIMDISDDSTWLKLKLSLIDQKNISQKQVIYKFLKPAAD